MQKKELVELQQVLDSIKDLGDTKFKYTILRNIQILKPYLSAIVDIEKEFQEILKDFESDRNALILELGEKKADGSVSIDNTNLETMKIFESKFIELKEKHEESFNKYNEKFEEFKNLLDDDFDEIISFRQMNIDKCPLDGLTSNQIKILLDFNIVTE